MEEGYPFVRNTSASNDKSAKFPEDQIEFFGNGVCSAFFDDGLNGERGLFRDGFCLFFQMENRIFPAVEDRKFRLLSR